MLCEKVSQLLLQLMLGGGIAYVNYLALWHLLRRGPACLRVDVPAEGIPGAAGCPGRRLGHICVILPRDLLQCHQVRKGRLGIGYRGVVHCGERQGTGRKMR